MLTHPDPQVQILLTAIEKQRDQAMVDSSNLQIALTNATAELEATKTRMKLLETHDATNVASSEPAP